MNGKSSVGRLIAGSWKTMVCVSVAMFGLLAYLILTATPWYMAETMLLLPSNPTPELADKSSAPYMPQTDPYLVRSYLDIIKSDDICDTVINQLDLAHNPEFESHASPIAPLIAYIKSLLPKKEMPTWTQSAAAAENSRILAIYKKHLSALNDGKSLILMLGYSAKDPGLATRIVNAQAAAYIAAQIDYRAREADIKSQWLKGQLLVAAKEVKTAQVALQMHGPLEGYGQAGSADSAAELKSRQAVAIAKATVYETLMSRYMVMVAEQHFVGSEVRVVSAATTPTSPKSPNVPVLLAVAALIAPLIGCLSAMAATYLFRAADPGGPAATLRLRSFGTIHLPSRMETAGFLPGARMRRAQFWEQIRALRNSLRRPGDAGTVISLVSTDRKASASLIAASLGRASASSGTRTLIIDLNLRQPKMHTMLRVLPNESAGLGELLHGTVDQADAVVPAGFNNSLFLLTSAKIRNVDMLGGTQIGKLVQRLRAHFDLIILDAPPVSFVSDAFSVAGLADGTLLVTRSRQASLPSFANLVSTLRENAVPLLGFVTADRARSRHVRSTDFKAYLASDPLADVRPLPGAVGSRRASRRSDLSSVEIGLAAERL